jgi:hypothetical protein
VLKQENSKLLPTKEDFMEVFRRLTRPIALMVTFCLLGLSVQLPVAQAGLVPTDSVLTSSPTSPAHAHVATWLARDDVKAELLARGVNPDQVLARVNSLTDAEADLLAAKIDQLPAGGSSFSSLLGVALIVFLVLLFTDIFGWTNVFPFTKKGSAKQ